MMIWSQSSIGSRETGTKPPLVTQNQQGPSLTSKSYHHAPKQRGIGHCISQWVCIDDLNFIIHPLNEELVQARRHTSIAMNPFAPKNQTVALCLHLYNEEGGGQCFAPDSKLHQGKSLGRNRISSNTFDRPLGLNQLLIRSTKLLIKLIWH